MSLLTSGAITLLQFLFSWLLLFLEGTLFV